MRSMRSRCVRPKRLRDMDRTIKRRAGVSQYMNNAQGRIAKIEALADQRRKQSNLCLRCGQHLDFPDAKFESDRFEDGVENRAIHRKCPV
jgi:hypothetical protein